MALSISDAIALLSTVFSALEARARAVGVRDRVEIRRALRSLYFDDVHISRLRKGDTSNLRYSAISLRDTEREVWEARQALNDLLHREELSIAGAQEIRRILYEKISVRESISELLMDLPNHGSAEEREALMGKITEINSRIEALDAQIGGILLD